MANIGDDLGDSSQIRSGHLCGAKGIPSKHHRNDPLAEYDRSLSFLITFTRSYHATEPKVEVRERKDEPSCQQDILYDNLARITDAIDIPWPYVLSEFHILDRTTRWCDSESLAPLFFYNWAFLGNPNLNVLERRENPSLEQNAQASVAFWTQYFHSVSDRSRILATRAGFLVLAAWSSHVGDVLVLPHGSPVPMLLRDAGDGAWTFEGFAYVNGIMNGELREKCPDLELPEEEFIIS